MLTTQFRINIEHQRNVTIQRVTQLASEVEKARQKHDALKNRVDELREELDQITSSPQLAQLRQKVEVTRLQAGLAPVCGPGVEVVLKDSEIPIQPGQDPNLYVLHDEDLLRVVNELRAAGAEALAINGERLLATSEIRCIGPTVLVNKTRRLVPPFVISAIGNPETMIKALEMPGGVLDILGFWGIRADVKKVPEIVIPAYSGSTTLEYASPLTNEGGDGVE
ncbi:MAG: DUF881 domain-containing protein [Peptococcaceae bacterium]|nr:DUF881 domain-containing protein [Peptococcaceae bacterium]